MIILNSRISFNANYKYHFYGHNPLHYKVLKKYFGFCLVLKLILILFILVPASLFSQSYSNTSGPGMNASLGLAFSRISDRQFSSQEYSGITPLFAARGQYAVGAGEHEFNISFTGGKLSTGSSASSNVKWQYASIEYAYLRQIGKQNGNWDNRLGAALSYSSSTRIFNEFINLDKNYEKFFSANALLQASYKIPGESGWAVSGQFMVSLCSFLSRPVTGINTPPNTGNGEGGDTEKLGSVAFIPELLRFKTFVRIEKTLAVQHKFMISYVWDAYKVEQEMQVSQASHQLFLTYGIDF
jgi:hypothetical protein